MTKNEFYEKWKVGSRESTVFYNKEEMLRDLERYFNARVDSLRDCVDPENEKTVDLDEWARQEGEAIQNRR